MNSNIEEVDVVEALSSVPGTSIMAGDRGTVLIKARGGISYLVEFSDALGVMMAEAWMTEESLRLIWSAATGQFVEQGSPVDAESPELVSA